MSPQTNSAIVSAALLLAQLTLPGKAAILYQNDFSGNLSDAGLRLYGFEGETSLLNPTTITNLSLESEALRISPQTNDRVVSISFPEVNLGIGDSLSVSFKVNVNSISGSKIFRYGFFNSLNSAASDVGDKGYFAGVEWASPTNNNSAVFVDAGSKTRFMMGTDISALTQASSAYGITTTTDWYSCAFTLTGVSGGVNITSRFAGEEINFLDSTYSITKLNSFAVQELSGKTKYLIDDVQIQLTTVPEPSTYVWLFSETTIVAGILLLRIQRRKKTA